MSFARLRILWHADSRQVFFARFWSLTYFSGQEHGTTTDRSSDTLCLWLQCDDGLAELLQVRDQGLLEQDKRGRPAGKRLLELCWGDVLEIKLWTRVAEVAREQGWHPPKSLDWDKKFKPEHTLFCRELRFVAIYALFLEIFGHKKCLFG